MSLPRTALVLLEQSSSFVMHHRPNRPGELAYPNKIHFLGGHVYTGEDPYDGMRREVAEKTEFVIVRAAAPEWLLWEGDHVGENNHGEPTRRHIGLFGVKLQPEDTVAVTEREGGEIVIVPPDLTELAARREEFAPFAYEALSTYIEHGRVIIGGSSGA